MSREDKLIYVDFCVRDLSTEELVVSKRQHFIEVCDDAQNLLHTLFHLLAPIVLQRVLELSMGDCLTLAVLRINTSPVGVIDCDDEVPMGGQVSLQTSVADVVCE